MPERPDHHSAEFDLVVDPDIDLGDPAQAEQARSWEWDVLLAIAVGGVAGAEARYALGRALPAAVGDFPWITLLVNVAGCLLIGVLMVIVLDVLPAATAREARGDEGPWEHLPVAVAGEAGTGAGPGVQRSPHRLMRPLLGTGVLGGFTTFSTFEVDLVRLVDDHHAITAMLYVVASLAGCLLAVWFGVTATTGLLVRDSEADTDAQVPA